MHIRTAVPADLPTLLDIYETARRFMVENGNPTQWPAGFINATVLSEDIVQRTLYVCEDENGIQGVFMFADGPDPTYAVIENGSWLSDAPYSVIHRVASAGNVKGLLAQMIAWASERAEVLRIDTHANNYPMQHLLAKLGFTRCGTIFAEDGTPRIAYQKG